MVKMSNNKTNILLLFTSVLFSLILIETYSYRKVKGKLKYGINKLGNKKEVNDFINTNVKTLHHLKRHINVETDNLSSLIYNKIGTGDKQILIQGDSWAEYLERDQKNIDMLLGVKNTQFLLAGTSSYSPSLMSAQLNAIRFQFGELPETIVAIIDQTDLGDELCRYKDLRDIINGKVIVRPVEPGQPGYYTLHSLFSKYEVLTSNIPFTLRLIKYELLNKQIVKRMKTSKNRCGYDDILGILKNNISKNDMEYWNDIFTEYINNVFSDPVTKNLLLVTHPHKKHLSGDYILDINDIIINSIAQSKYKDRITLVNPFNIKLMDKIKIRDIFIEEDSYSHLQADYITNYYLPKIIQAL